VPRLPAALRRTQLLDEALGCFGAEGYQGTSMNDIANSAGVTKPVLYQHFGSKEELYRELLGDVASQLQRAIIEGVAGATGPKEQVEQGFAAFFHWVAEDPSRFRMLYSTDTRREPLFRDEAIRVEQATAAAVTQLIVVDGMDGDHRTLLGYGIIGMAEVMCRRWVEGGIPFDPDELAAYSAELAWKGLRGIGGP
jgi:AcrR family transcriptional regulator